MQPDHHRCLLTLAIVAAATGCGPGSAQPPATPAPTQQAAPQPGIVDGSNKTLAELFHGRAGVAVTQVSGGVKLQIRGAQNHDGTPASPLYVIDGLPIQPPDGVLSINPNDVLKIEILKDDASTLIWGERAVNGVVKITTKRK